MKKLIAILLCVMMTFTYVPAVYATDVKEISSEVIAPVAAEVTPTSITLEEVDGYEYSIGGEVWQPDPVFNDLKVYTTYTFYQRVAEGPGEISDAIKIQTRKYEAEAPPAPELDFVSDTLIRVKYTKGYEYKINGGSWSTRYSYGGLKPETEYTLYQRTAATKTHYASLASQPLVIKTKKPGEESVSPVVTYVDVTTIRLKDIIGYEYSLDSTVWQDSNVFTNVEPLSEYTVYQRIKETDNAVAGTITSKTVFTPKATEVPEGYKGIYSKNDLSSIRDDLNGKYILMNNLEFTDGDFEPGGEFYNDGKGWSPIGSYQREFTGIFNGNGYYIDGLYINENINEYYGLFGYNSGTIRNLGLANCSITSIVEEYEESEFVKVSNLVGGIAGCNKGKIDSCYVSGKITGKCRDKDLSNYTGGIAARNDEGEINNCFNEATVSSISHGNSYSNSGGICGKGIATDSYNIGNVYGLTGKGAVATVGGISPYYSNVNCYSINIINDARLAGLFDGGNTYLSDLEMKKQESFGGFDFENIWTIEDGDYPYPTLKNVEHKEFIGESGYADGKGTVYDPYIIKTEEQLKDINKNPGAKYELACDIKLDGKEDWVPIGATEKELFYGTLDGKGHVISNVQIDKKTDKEEAVGLFGYSAGLIKNLGVIDGSVKLTVTNVDNIHNTTGYAGGIVGYNSGVIITSYNGNKVAAIQAGDSESTSLDAGGIAGYSKVIRNCYNFGNVVASGGFAEAAGIAADSLSDCIDSCYNCGKVVYDVNSNAEALGIGSSSVMKNVYSLPVSNLHHYEDRTVFLSEDEMSKQESFSGFNFENIWEFNSNYDYPQLKAVKHIHSPENNTDFAGGRGTKSEPYVLKSAKHLVNAAKYPDAYFVLENNIDMSGEEWAPLGPAGNDPFMGVIDGNGYAIESIYMSEAQAEGDNTGFIGYNAGIIRNITFDGGIMYKVSAGGSETHSGIICAYNSITGVIENTDVNNTKLIVEASSGDNAVGGLVGHNRGLITTSAFSGTVDVTLKDSARGEVGGFTGHNHRYGTIEKSYNNGLVSGSNSHATKVHTYWGGFIGYHDGKLYNSYNTGDMQIINPRGTLTSTYVSLMAAYMEDNCTVKNVYHCATSTVDNITRRSNVYYLGDPHTFENVYFVDTLSTEPVHGTALSESEMADKASYQGFDFDNVWLIDSESSYKYPQLRDNPYETKINDISNIQISGVSEEYEFTGKEVCPEIRIEGLREGKDYQVSYRNNINPGTAIINIKGTGELYTGSITINFRIIPKDIRTIPVEGEIASDKIYICDGNEIRPEVHLSGLAEGLDYKLTYSNNLHPGTGTVLIEGIGNYTGVTDRSFIIELPQMEKPVIKEKRLVPSSGYDDVYVKWTKSANATGYRVYYKRSTWSNYKHYKDVTSLYCTVKDLTDGAKYYFRIYPYLKIEDTKYRSSKYAVSSYIYTLKKVNKPTVKKSTSKKVKVSWTNINGESGYQISRSSKSSGTYIVSTIKSSTVKNKVISASKGKTYYYKVRAYKNVTVNGVTKKVYGPWSTTYKYKLK